MTGRPSSISKPNWDKILFYSKRIRSIVLPSKGSGVLVPEDTMRAFQQCIAESDIDLFPNLAVVHLSDLDMSPAVWSILLGPNVRNIQLPFFLYLLFQEPPNIHVKPYLDEVAVRCTRLETINLSVFPSEPPVATLGNFFRRTSRLKTISWNGPSDPGVWSLLSLYEGITSRTSRYFLPSRASGVTVSKVLQPMNSPL